MKKSLLGFGCWFSSSGGEWKDLGRGQGPQTGASVCLTGRLAKEGNYVKDGYTLWMEEVNKKGGIKVGNDRYKVEIIFYDDKSDPQTGPNSREAHHGGQSQIHPGSL